MPRALIINPNTSEAVTALLHQHARTQLDDSWEIRCVTARFGASYIASELAYMLAGHAVLDAYALDAASSGCEAILIGCFGDPGLHALQEIATAPVTGLAEAAMREASQRGRFSIVTGGPRWAPILRRLAAGLELPAELAGIHLLTQSGAELAADPQRAHALLAESCRHAMQADSPAAIVLGGAALAGMGERLADELGLPIIDNVSAGLRAMVDRSSQRPAIEAPDSAHYSGLSAELQSLLGQA